MAEVLRRHGATASAFSDWWAYKIEVQDAIPYGGAIMHDQGIIVSFNSDDPELARHLNQEAAKAVKYGGLAGRSVEVRDAESGQATAHRSSRRFDQASTRISFCGAAHRFRTSRCEQTADRWSALPIVSRRLGGSLREV
ncbi:MAG: hypothetical protein R3B96_11045 [Pirellulaceae bacterium]